jgi:hypothetical protein
MDIYERLVVNNNASFEKLISTLFEEPAYEKDLYTYMKDYVITNDKEILSKQFPYFYQIFLQDPSKFADFLQTITDASQQNRGNIYNGMNIVTLICFSTFHLTKLYIMMSRSVNNYEAATFFHLPLSKWIRSVLFVKNADNFDLTQDVNGYFRPVQYLLIMTYVSKELPFNERPLFVFMATIEEKYLQDKKKDKTVIRHNYIEIRFFEDIFYPLIMGNNLYGNMQKDYIDIHKYSVLHQYNILSAESIDDKVVLIDYVYLLDDTDARHIFYNIFNNRTYNITYYLDDYEEEIDFLDYLDQHSGEYEQMFKSYWKTYLSKESDNLLTTLTERSLRSGKANMFESAEGERALLMFMFLAGIFHYKYSIFNTDADEIFRIDTKWNKMMNVLAICLYNSNHLELDLLFLYDFMDYSVTIDHYWYKSYEPLSSYKKGILSSVITSKHIKSDPVFIRKLLKSLIIDKNKQKYIHLDEKEQYHKFLTKIDDKNENALSLLLNVIYDIGDHSSNNDFRTLEYRKSFVDNSQSKPSLYSTKDLHFENTMSHIDEQNLGLYFKDVIINLLKLSENMVKNDKYILNLMRYRDKLLEIGVNLDDFKVTKVERSSPENWSRTIDQNNIVPSIRNDSKVNARNIMKKQNDSVFSDLEFTDDKQDLLKKLQQINAKTVEGIIKGEYDKPNRIIKIRKYLQKKYPMSMAMSDEFKLTVTKDQEFDILYDYWLGPGNKRSLNAKYFIRYAGTPGIDASGLTKQFFTQIGKQMRDRYFKTAYNESDRYILNSKNIPTDDMAQFIGELLAVFIIKGIYIDFNLSLMYLASLMYDNNTFRAEEKFLYYLLDIEKETRYNNYLRHCEHKYEYEEEDDYDENYLKAMACTPAYVVNEYLPDIYNHKKEHFDAFCRGFFINKRIFNSKFVNIKSKIRIYDLDKLISMPKLGKKYLKSKVFDQIFISTQQGRRITDKNPDAKVYTYLRDIMIKDKKSEYSKLYKAYDTSWFADESKIELYKQNYADLADPNKFKKSVMMFWSGTEGVSEQQYKVTIYSTIGDTIKGHTCFNTIDLPTSDKIESKQRLFNILVTYFIKEIHTAFDNS